MSQNDIISPADIRQKRFATAWRGFQKEEVKAFLDQTADALTALLEDHESRCAELERQQDRLQQEIESLRADVARQQAELAEFKIRETLIKDTLINAQQVIETMKANAEKEGEIRIHEAELKAERILQETFARQAKLRQDIDELKRQKVTFAAQLRGLLDNYQRLLQESEAGD